MPLPILDFFQQRKPDQIDNTALNKAAETAANLSVSTAQDINQQQQQTFRSYLAALPQLREYGTSQQAMGVKPMVQGLGAPATPGSNKPVSMQTQLELMKQQRANYVDQLKAQAATTGDYSQLMQVDPEGALKLQKETLGLNKIKQEALDARAEATNPGQVKLKNISDLTSAAGIAELEVAAKRFEDKVADGTITPSSFGIFGTLGQTNNPLVPYSFMTKNAQETDQMLKNINSLVVLARSGKQATDAEAKRLAALLPRIGDDKDTMMWKMRELQSVAKTLLSRVKGGGEFAAQVRQERGLGGGPVKLNDADEAKIQTIMKNTGATREQVLKQAGY